jgi:hypothetical protein
MKADKTGTLYLEYPSDSFLKWIEESKQPYIIDKMEHKLKIKEMRVFAYKLGSFTGYIGNRAILELFDNTYDEPKFYVLNGVVL